MFPGRLLTGEGHTSHASARGTVRGVKTPRSDNALSGGRMRETGEGGGESDHQGFCTLGEGTGTLSSK